jgi:hypothetical protein
LRYIIKVRNERNRLQSGNCFVTSHILGGFKMSKLARDSKVKDLLDKQKFSEKDIAKMSDPQIEYYHWLYFADSVYDYM